MSVESNGYSVVYLFGDRHTDDRESVKQRILSITPHSADAIIMEHADKGDTNPQPTNWAWLMNSSLLIVHLLILPIQYYLRRRSNRIFFPHQTSVPEEVAEELNVDIEFTDISWERRIWEQPHYLTVFSTLAVVLLIYSIATLNPILVIISVVMMFANVFGSYRIYKRVRERKMADDIIELSEEYSVMVLMVGDSHIEPIRNRLENKFITVTTPESRPS